MTTFIIKCNDCGQHFKTKNPKPFRYCPVCKEETPFTLMERPPLLSKGKPCDILCCRCQRLRHLPDGVIPPKCPECGHPFNHHAGNTSLIDVIYNRIVGSDDENKGYVKVDIARDGTIWWKPDKDSDPELVSPFLGDMERSGYPVVVYGNQNNDLTPLRGKNQTTRRKDFRRRE
jgi:hypothetical protein